MLKADRKPADHNVKFVLKFGQNTLYCEIPKSSLLLVSENKGKISVEQNR